MTEHIRGRVDAYLEGLLDPGSEARFDQHVAGCGSCRNALDAARQTRLCMDWLMPAEVPPVPGPEFYVRVEQSIEKRISRSWIESLAAALHPRLAYPLVFLGLLAAAWTLTYASREPEEALAAIEYPATEFAHMAFTTADHDQSEDLVMRNLVELPEEQ